MEPTMEKKSNGALIGSIIIIVILVVGAIYIWQSKVKNTLDQKNQPQTENVTPAESAQSLDALQQDLNSTDTNLNVNVNAID